MADGGYGRRVVMSGYVCWEMGGEFVEDTCAGRWVGCEVVDVLFLRAYGCRRQSLPCE